jgi:hypothetical protein
MTRKTQSVAILSKGGIKPGRVFFLQKPEMLAAMGEMTSFAVFLCYGAMHKLLVFNLICESSKGLIFTYINRFIMA